MTADAQVSVVEQLHKVVPAHTVLTDDASLHLRSRDWWPLNRLRETRGDVLDSPRAVVLPESSEQVAALLAWATASKTPLVPRGLGSGVCGGVTPKSDSVVIELSAMNKVLELDPISQVVHVEAGIRGDVLEAALNEAGLTLGHYPQSMNLSTVGGWIAAWSSGQASPGYGSIEHHLAGLTFVLADGTIVKQRPLPRPAVGPDLRRLMVGSEGTFGVVTEAWLSCAPLDPAISWQAMTYPDFAGCLDATREIFRSGVGMRVLRGWDEADTRRGFSKRFGVTSGCVGLVGIPTSAPGLAGRQEHIEGIATKYGATPLPSELGETWWAHRLDAVDVFESVLGPDRVYGVGSMLDTVEVSALWSDLLGVYEAVRAALSLTTDEVRGHFSHVYPIGAALYFTFVLRRDSDAAVEDAYHETWANLVPACQDAGGSIAHHHGVGRLKLPALEREITAEGIEVLRRLKLALDPAGILNPGLLS